MRPFRPLILLFLLIPTVFHAQKSLTGLWTGTLTNDSSTVRKDQSFEIALTQYKEKVYGYSRATFIVHDTLFYIVKRVKGTVNADVCEIKDDEIISCNFPARIDKGVKVTTTFTMNQQDSVWHLNGDWNTNKTKKFYAISGKIELKDEPDLEKSKIFPHLEELKLAKDVPFYAAKKQQEAAAKEIAAAPKKETPVKNKPAEKLSKKDNTTNPTETAIVKNEPKKQDPVSTTKPAEEKNNPAETSIVKKETTKPAQETAITKPTEEKNKPTATITETKKQDVAVIKKPEVIIPVAAAMVKERKTLPPQEVSFVSDSLQLALYDNGEVDGDTVSVLLNGDIILAKQGLSTAAIKKTLYIAPGTDEITLVLYAENLGKYPPNTGLLVVYDGEERYQVRFSADLQQNASVVFKRKRK